MTEATWFGARLRELREAAGLTQPQLAERVGISTRQVSRLETGDQVATWPTVLALAKALGVDCTAFATRPAGQPAPKRGRPRKEGGAAPAEPPHPGPAPAKEPAPSPPAGESKPARSRRRKGGQE